MEGGGCGGGGCDGGLYGRAGAVGEGEVEDGGERGREGGPFEAGGKEVSE